MTTMIIAFKKIENDDATKHTTFYSTQKQKWLLMW